MFISRLVFTIVLFFYCLVGIAGDRQGNGGDHVRNVFLRMGAAVISYLETTKEGLALVGRSRLNLQALKDTLSIHRVFVVEGVLKDNGGSDVDAVGEPGSITLKKQAWLDHFEAQRDVYFIVFHEMLRSAGYQDDNYIISNAINPFPPSFKIPTRGADIPPTYEQRRATLIARYGRLAELAAKRLDDFYLTETLRLTEILVKTPVHTKDDTRYNEDYWMAVLASLERWATRSEQALMQR